MRADNVEPRTLRTLLADAAVRVAAARVEQRSTSGLLAKPPIDRRRDVPRRERAGARPSCAAHRPMRVGALLLASVIRKEGPP